MYKRGRSGFYSGPAGFKRPRVYGPKTGTFRSGYQTARYRAANKRSQSGPRTAGSLLQQVKALQRFVKNLAPEIKYYDASLAVTNVPAAGSVINCTQIAAGDLESTRTANLINVTSIDMSGYFLRNSTDFAADAYCRVALVVDKEQIADTAPTAADVFQNTGIPTEALPNTQTLTRFRVLWLSPVFDLWRMRLDSDNLAASTPTQNSTWSHNWKGNIKVQYNGSASTDIQKNGIYVIYLTSTAVTTLDVTGTLRLGYTDV